MWEAYGGRTSGALTEDVMAARYLRCAMNEPRDDPIGPLIRELDEASETLAGIPMLTRPEAEQVGVRIDRLTSQLTSISPSGRAGLLDDLDRAD